MFEYMIALICIIMIQLKYNISLNTKIKHLEIMNYYKSEELRELHNKIKILEKLNNNKK